MSTTTVERVKEISEMNAEEKAAYDKLTPIQKARYDSKLVMQRAKDAVKATADAKKLAKDRETAIKAIIADIKAGTLVIDNPAEGDAPATLSEAFSKRFDALPEADKLTEEERKTITERIRKDAVKNTQTRLPETTAPAFTLEHLFSYLGKGALIPPTDGGRPDVTLINSVKRFGIIEPFLVKKVEEGKYYILNGKRRYHLLAEGETIPAVIVQGFPDAETEEKAEVIVNRVRSLNVLSTADIINRMRTRGVTDTVLRRDLGFKTGEIDKLASVTLALNKDVLTLLKNGIVAPATALSIAKLPADLQAELYRGYTERQKAFETNGGQPARISEADVEGIRQMRAANAAKRDTPTLSGLSSGVEDFKSEGVDGNGGAAVNSENANAAPGDAPEGGYWQENVFEKLETVRAALPQDSGVQAQFNALVEHIALSSPEGFANEPEETADASVTVKGKDVPNVSANRKGWKTAATKALPQVLEVIPTDAPDTVFKAYDALKDALKAANPNGDGSAV